MNVLVVEPYKEPYEKEIEPGLESLQHEIGGEVVSIPFGDSPPAPAHPEPPHDWGDR